MTLNLKTLYLLSNKEIKKIQILYFLIFNYWEKRNLN